MDREQMINELIDSVDDWEIESLIAWVKAERRNILEKRTDKEIEEIFTLELG